MLDNHVDARFVLLYDDSLCPRRYYPGDAGYDLYSYEDICVEPSTVRKIRTGIAIDLGKGVVAEIRGRSSNYKFGFFVINGTVDNQYKGEIEVIVYNFKPTTEYHDLTNDNRTRITKGQRVAQIVLQPLLIAKDEPKTQYILDRGNEGFGSTGK